MIPKYTGEWNRGRGWRGDFAPMVFTVNPFDSYGVDMRTEPHELSTSAAGTAWVAL